MKNNTQIKIIHKIIIINLIIILFTYINLMFYQEVQAVHQNKDIVISTLADLDKINEEKYPGYKALIKTLKEQHPNWTFTILQTNLDWNQVLKNESTVKHSRNLVPSNKTGEWLCLECGTRTYDSGRWCCASIKAVAYYMDPRNFLNTENIFQFETLSYVDGIQTIEGVQKIIAGTFMEGETIQYVTTTEEKGILEKSYAQVIMEAAELANVSPYHLASRIKQEQGNSGSSTGNGQVAGHIGYYNIFNVNASGNGTSTIINNAMNYARQQGWDNPEKSIVGGAQFLAKSYISIGQNTLYLQKFDVDNFDGALYYHQYMQNIMAPLNEGNTMYSSYNNLGMIDSQINFLIPVYENMPSEISQIPSNNIICTENVIIKGTEINIRQAPNTSATVITMLNTGDTILRIEQATGSNNGYYWDKIVLNDGTIGYVVRNYIEKIEDIKTCEEKSYINTIANLRNGPGITGTTVIQTLSINKEVTIIDKAKFVKDGYTWDRILLSDGTQGYIATNFLNNTKQELGESMKVIADGGLMLRNGPGTNTSTITIIEQNTIVTRLEKGTELITGYYWDKIRTTDGLEGYVASNYLINIEEEIPPIEIPSEDKKEEIITEGVVANKIDKIVKMDSDIDYEKISNANPDIIVKDTSGNIITDKIGTGAIIIIETETYTVVKAGDTTGDGEITPLDYVKIKNNIMDVTALEGCYKLAGDVTGDGELTPLDYVKVKNAIMNSTKISAY